MTHPATTQDWRIGGFGILEVVAESARATVYRATDGAREIALKIYSDVFDTRARVESAALGKLRHPAIARLVAAGPLDDRYMIATEWIEGAPLGAVHTWRETRRIVTAIAAGLGAIHEAGVVHGDLEPSNVIVRASGRPAATIVDFSHALVAASDRMTSTGSAAYMSPEQAQGTPLDGRSDLYALGVIFYELLCGELPFEGTPEELSRRHLREPVIAPRKRAPDRDIPKVAEDVCMWLLVKDRDARLPNARVFAITIAATEVSP